MALPTRIEVSTVSIGTVQELAIKGRLVKSAICKRPIYRDFLEVTELGIVGDEQADPKHHGGLDMAVYVYPFIHYPAWEQGNLHLLDRDECFTTGELITPAFGENLTLAGHVDETMVRIGDLFAWGNQVILQVTKPREPCFKFEHVMGAGASDKMKANGRCGWYCSVQRPGTVAIDDALVFLGHDPSTPNLQPTVREAFYAKVRRPQPT